MMTYIFDSNVTETQWNTPKTTSKSISLTTL
jgi:hypothetical protein